MRGAEGAGTAIRCKHLEPRITTELEPNTLESVSVAYKNI